MTRPVSDSAITCAEVRYMIETRRCAVVSLGGEQFVRLRDLEAWAERHGARTPLAAERRRGTSTDSSGEVLQ